MLPHAIPPRPATDADLGCCAGVVLCLVFVVAGLA